jgi:hypothetical protein
MSLLLVFSVWLFLGGSIYRARKRALSMPENRPPKDSHIELAHRGVRAEIPDTVPSDWIEAYRAERGD